MRDEHTALGLAVLEAALQATLGKKHQTLIATTTKKKSVKNVYR